ncbi:hypothetical protein EMCRGX_G010562 [Ephydatia muelleri]
MKAWNILHSDCAQTALELVKYQHIICQLFAPDGNLEVCKALLAGHSYAQAAYLGWEVLKEDMLVWCVTHQPFHARQQPVPSRLTTTPAGTTLSTIQARSVSTLAGATRGQSAILLTVKSHYSMTSELTPLYEQRSHTTLRPASSHHSTTNGTHTTLRSVNSHHSTNSELTPLYDQRAHTTLRSDLSIGSRECRECLTDMIAC